MRFTARFFASFTLLASLSLVACSGGQPNGLTTSPQASSGAGSVAGSSAGGTTGPQTSAGSGTASGGSATGSSSGGTSSGTPGSTGTTTGLPPVFVDGGYVSCMLASAVDAGASGGGAAYWNCGPGTYFCDLSGDIGNCFECQSDTDCLNTNLPTYDPRKPHCDTSSGVLGAEHSCQECTRDADCTGNPNGSFCDVNPSFLQPAIETLGFETCNRLVTDCRLDGGVICGAINQYCDSQTGHCLTKSGACQGDDDCIGYLSPYSANVPEPYCYDGGCNSCQGGLCPAGFCTSDTACPNGTFCDLNSSPPSYYCKCTDSSQCGGLWPVCTDIQTNDAGLTFGSCGCDSNDECDPGLQCITSYLGTSCGVPCTSPEFPASCQDATNFYPVCNAQTGVCVACSSDAQCRIANDPNGPRCDATLGGFGSCGCFPGNDEDCAAGEVCQPNGTGNFGTCAAALTRCTPGSCSTGFCNWDSGTCVASGAGQALCLNEFDCAVTSYTASTCVKGTCLQCQSNSDCLGTGGTKTTSPICCLPGVAGCDSFPNNTCAGVCTVDADCDNNSGGSNCIESDAGFPPHCGCGSDNDCTGSAFGGHCDRNPSDSFFGYCTCAEDGDCSPGEACQIYGGGTTGFCGSYCYSLDAGSCADGYFCDPKNTCRPRCDNGNQCQGTTLCDTLNSGGENDQLFGAAAPGVQWCYSCVSPSDCQAGQGCDPRQGCNTCSSDANCPSGTACVDGGICQPTCVGGTCANGQVCDVFGLAGFGTDICYECLSAKDCPNSEGCNSQSHTCGTCYGPNATINVTSDPFDCPPDAICSNYWTYTKTLAPGVCLANCDRTACPATEPICAVFPAITPDHKYCFGCLTDQDCAANQRCNLDPDPTFTCVPKT